MHNESILKQQRKQMVSEQLIPRGIINEKVLEAFLEVPRHNFIPEKYRHESYNDYPIAIGEGQTISQPYIVALMTQTLDIKKTDRILEIGTGSGYQTAILAELADSVYTIERLPTLSNNAKNTLDRSGYKNIQLKSGDGTLGWAEFAPYDSIIVTCAAPSVPQPLEKQLKEHGKIIIPIGGGFSQTLMLMQKDKDKFTQQEICGCAFVPLIGKYGWKENTHN